MLHHAALSAGYPGRLRAFDAFIHGGVTAFLVLSGFLITRSLLNDEDRLGRVSFQDFYQRQAVRFYVPLLTYLAAASILFGVLVSAVPWSGVAHVLMLHPATASTDLRTAHLYSMVLQLQFCLLWPVVLRFTPRPARLPVVITLAAGATLWGVTGSYWVTELHGARERTDLLFGPLLVGAAFALRRPAEAQGAVWRKRPADALAIALALGAILLTRSPSKVIALMSPRLVEALAPLHGDPHLVMALRWLGGIAAYLSFGLLVYLLAHGRCPVLSRIFSVPPLVWLGRISFSVYLWQNLFFFCARGLPVGRFPWNLAASIACGLVAYLLIELPSLRWRSGLVRREVSSEQ